MPRYQVTLEGRTFVLEGDHPPSEAEARAAIGAHRPETPKSNAQRSTADLQKANLTNRADLPSTSGFLSNVVSSTGRFATDSVKGIPALLPALVKLAQGASGDPRAAMDVGRAVPAVGAAAVEGAKQRYGGVDRALSTAYHDPAGVAADVSTVAGLGSLAAGSRAPRIARALSTVSDVTNPATLVTKPLQKAADVASDVVIGGTVRPSKAVRDDFGGRRGVAQAIKRERTYSEASAQRKLTRSTQEADDLLTAREAAGVRGVPARDVADALTGKPAATAARRDALGVSVGMHGGSPSQAVAARRQAVLEANAIPGHPNATRIIPLTEAQALKREAQDLAYEAAKNNLSLDQQANSAIARALRGGIEQRVPEIAGINERSQRLLAAQRAFAEAQDRPRALTNFLSILGGAGGFAGGGPGGAAVTAALIKAMDSPRVGSALGIGINDLGRGLFASRRAALASRLAGLQD